MNKVALITGVTGQDGAYLSEFLLKKGYTVHGLKRRTSLFNTDRIDHLYQDPHVDNQKFILHHGDMTDSTNLTRLLQQIQPDEIYNLAAMSHVRVSFDMPEYVADADGIGTLRLLEAIRLLGLEQKTRIYQASTSELYGKVQEVPQTETTPFYPRSPYAVAKMYAYWITVNYREAYDIFACNGILFNHMTDSTNLTRLLQQIQPDEIYNLAAMSHVRVSFDMPEYVADADGIGTLRLLEAIRLLGLEQKTRIYQASTSELYGKVQEVPQTETTPFYPRSPYAVAKMYAYWITVNYREAYDIFACNGILFNHESPLRGETFVTRKITRAVSRIALGLQDKFYLGNLNSKRDWGHAKDYIRMMWMILQADTAEDWVIATGRTTTIRDFVKMAFAHIGVSSRVQRRRIG